MPRRAAVAEHELARLANDGGQGLVMLLVRIVLLPTRRIEDARIEAGRIESRRGRRTYGLGRGHAGAGREAWRRLERVSGNGHGK